MATVDPDSAPGDSPGPLGEQVGEESAGELLARLYREHNHALVRFLCTRLDSEEEAQDVAQEAYARMLQLNTHGAVSFLSAYLFRTAANLAVDRLRHRYTARHVEKSLKEEPQPVVAPERILEGRETLALIDRFVQDLPPKCRQAFYLHRLHDLTPSQIADRLGVTKRMVHHYLVRALAYVRSRLDAEEKPS